MKKTHTPTQSLRAGLFGIGLDTYLPQFEGLKGRPKGYLAQVTAKLAKDGIEIQTLC